MPYSEAQPTYIGTGAGLGALGFTGANIVKRVFSKKPPKVSALKSYPASAAYGLILGALTGNSITKKANVKEIDYTMNQDLMKACELAKLAADMTVPLENKPAPAPGSDVVPGMTTNTVYDETVAQEALAKAKQVAACGAAKTAAEVSDEFVNRARSLKKDIGYSTGLGLGAAALQGLGLAALAKGKAGLGAGLMGLSGVAGMGAMIPGTKTYYDAYKLHKADKAMKTASVEDYVNAAYDYVNAAYGANEEADYAEKLAAAENSLTVEDAALAMDAAEAMYNEAMEKVAFAQDLYGEAAEFLVGYNEMLKEAAAEPLALPMGNSAKSKAVKAGRDAKSMAGSALKAMKGHKGALAGTVAAGLAAGALAKKSIRDAVAEGVASARDKMKEKTASDYAPIAGSAMGAAVGATAGLAAGSRFGGPRAGMVGAALGAATGAMGGNVAGAAAPGALQHFKAALMG